MVKIRINRISIFIFTGIFGYLNLDYLFNITDYLFKFFGRDNTLTGRTDIWADCFSLVGSKIFGVGYGNFWLGKRLEFLWDKWWWKPITAHNGYIDVFLELGAIGLALLLLTFLYSYFRILKKFLYDFLNYRFFLVILLSGVIYNIAESAFLVPHIFWLCILFSITDYNTIHSDLNNCA